MISDVEHVFMHLLDIVLFCLSNVYLSLFFLLCSVILLECFKFASGIGVIWPLRMCLEEFFLFLF